MQTKAGDDSMQQSQHALILSRQRCSFRKGGWFQDRGAHLEREGGFKTEGAHI